METISDDGRESRHTQKVRVTPTQLNQLGWLPSDPFQGAVPLGAANDSHPSAHASPFPPDQDLDLIDLGTFSLRHFLEVGNTEPLELTSVGRRMQVAHASSLHSMIRLMRAGERLPESTGVYLVGNKINPAITARYQVDTWHQAWNHRASDNEVTTVRFLPIDCDAKRPAGISATPDEKKASYELSVMVEEYLATAFGGDDCLGRMDSGNGYWVLVALEPVEFPADEDESKELRKSTGQKLCRFLTLLSKKFQVKGAKVDTTAHNPARLIPAPGTLKTKGVSGGMYTLDRLHERTAFCCRPVVKRIPLEAL